MKVSITPSKAVGTVNAPPSKSMAHRALLTGALTDGSKISNIAYSKDIEATLSCLREMGARVNRQKNSVLIGGLEPSNMPKNAVLPCNESGSTLRFLLPICMLCGHPVTLKGTKRLFERPLTVYENIAKEHSIFWQQGEDYVTVCGNLKSGKYTVPGNISSQFITGLLYAMLTLKEDSEIVITKRLESASYINLTISTLQEFGITIKHTPTGFYVPGGQKVSARHYTVEGDYSNAAFLEGLNLLGGNVKVEGLLEDSLQGDRVYRQMFSQLLSGKREFDLSDCPDLAPVMFALAAAKGGANFTGTARLRFKESDRAAAMAEELQKFGIKLIVKDNLVTVPAGVLIPPCAPLNSHNDHRIAMALALLCTVTGGTICDAMAVKKSFPNFFDTLKYLKIGLTTHDS